MKNSKCKVVIFLFILQLLPFIDVAGYAEMRAGTNSTAKESILYDRKLNDRKAIPELLLNNAGAYRKDGLDIVQKDSIVKLNLCLGRERGKVSRLILG